MAKTPEEIKEYKRRYYLANKEKLSLRHKKYYDENKDRIKNQTLAYYYKTRVLKGRSDPWNKGMTMSKEYRQKLSDAHVLKDENKYRNRFGKREHRRIVEEHIGRELRRDELIHHINGKPGDNRIENLFVCDMSTHKLIHFRGASTREECEAI
jgi:hypothetical protein